MMLIPSKAKKDKCPICGAKGRNLKIIRQNVKTCPSCGTVFNEFGIIWTLEENFDYFECN